MGSLTLRSPASRNPSSFGHPNFRLFFFPRLKAFVDYLRQDRRSRDNSNSNCHILKVQDTNTTIQSPCSDPEANSQRDRVSIRTYPSRSPRLEICSFSKLCSFLLKHSTYSFSIVSVTSARQRKVLEVHLISSSVSTDRKSPHQKKRRYRIISFSLHPSIPPSLHPSPRFPSLHLPIWYPFRTFNTPNSFSLSSLLACSTTHPRSLACQTKKQLNRWNGA